MYQVEYDGGTRVSPRIVWFKGTVALKKGQGLCYDRDYYTALTGEALVDAYAMRDRFVDVPDGTNNRAFAGVAAQNYDAKSVPQRVQIYEPGSVCELQLGIDVVAGTTRLTCSASEADGGRFVEVGFGGRGSAIALQTNASGRISESLDGTAAVSGTVTLTKTALFANAVVGDRVVILGGDDGAPTPGVYTIVTRTSADVVQLDSAPGNGDVACYVIKAVDQYALCLLEDGAESNLTEWLAPTGATTLVPMVGGVTNFVGGYDVGTSDSLAVLADGDEVGLRKEFKLWGALATNDQMVTPATAGVQLDGTTALNAMEFDNVAAVDRSLLEWVGPYWKLIQNTGTALT